MGDDPDQSALLVRLREYLKDPTAPYLWTDEVLRIALYEGIMAYSAIFPYQGTKITTTAANTNAYSMTGANVMKFFRVVDCKLNGVAVPEDPSIDGFSPDATGRFAQAYAYNPDTELLTLRNAPIGNEIGAGKLVVHYHAPHYPWTMDNTDAFTPTSIPKVDWALLVLLAAREAFRQLVVQGLKTPVDLDPGNAVVELDTAIAEQIRIRTSSARFQRLHR